MVVAFVHRFRHAAPFQRSIAADDGRGHGIDINANVDPGASVQSAEHGADAVEAPAVPPSGQ